MKECIRIILSYFLLLFIPLGVLIGFYVFKQEDVLDKAGADHTFLSHVAEEKERSFVLLLYSMGAPQTYEKSFLSILSQAYPSYRIILIETRNLSPHRNYFQQMAARSNKLHLLKILPFDEELPTIETFYKAINLCKNDEIVVQLECNDWLVDENVLSKLNHTYFSQKAWLTYAHYLEYPSYQKSKIEPFVKNLLRYPREQTIPWLSSPLKIYYAGLFKKIQITHTNCKRPLIPETLDLFFMPLAKYSHKHICFVDDILYVHNTQFSRVFPQDFLSKQLEEQQLQEPLQDPSDSQ